ncbi:hypothetical protein Hanom_Chr12g01127911 [Helianthus anomalus]
MILDSTLIIIEKLDPTTLPHIQFLLVEDMLKAPVIGIDGTLGTVQVMPPNLQRKDYGS